MVLQNQRSSGAHHTEALYPRQVFFLRRKLLAKLTFLKLPDHRARITLTRLERFLYTFAVSKLNYSHKTSEIPGPKRSR